MEQFLEEADEDVLCIILSFLSPPEISRLAQVSTRIRGICKGEDSGAKLWRPMCLRRWGSSTSLHLWNPKQTLHYKSLYNILSKWEHLIGFWRGVGNRSQLLAFEWGSRSIQGFRIVAASKGSLQVRRIPFLWIGGSNGDEICVLNPELSSSSSEECDRCHLSPELQPACSTSNDIFSKIDADWDVQELSELGLVLVKLEFAGMNHFVLEELRCGKQTGRKKKMSLAEAVASASFGFSDDGWSSEVEKFGKSPPGSFPYEMFQFLTSKVSPGSDRAARKQRKKEKERAGGRRIFEQQHYVKVVNCSPTKARPLEGLWKGVCQCEGLDFVLVSYNEQGVVICKQIGETGKRARSWLIESPCGGLEDESSSGGEHQVGGVFEFDKSEEKLSGRIWIHPGGGFKFAQLHTNHVIDFRSICSGSSLLDVVC